MGQFYYYFIVKINNNMEEDKITKYSIIKILVIKLIIQILIGKNFLQRLSKIYKISIAQKNFLCNNITNNV